MSCRLWAADRSHRSDLTILLLGMTRSVGRAPPHGRSAPAGFPFEAFSDMRRELGASAPILPTS